jgi:hypothetical protein
MTRQTRTPLLTALAVALALPAFTAATARTPVPSPTSTPPH